LNFGSPVVVDYTNIVASGLGGGAISNVDFALANLPVTFNPGDLTKDINLVTPINDALQEGTETVVLGLAPSADGPAPFAVTTNRATANLIDDEYVTPERVLFSDTLNGDSSASWKVAFAANNGIDDQLVSWGFTLANDSVSNAPNGSATALKVTVNKFEASPDGAAGINLYPLSKTFSNNFALRFNMYQRVSGGATTEYALVGVNHSGSKTNWLIQNGVGSVTNTDADGYWFAISADGSGSAPGDYCLFRGNGPSAPPLLVASAAAGTFNQAFKSPPFFAPGAVGNDANTLTPTWVDVEIRKVNNTITLRINNTVVISQGNATNFTSGDIMLGFADPYMSIGADGAVYLSNVRVVDLTPAITSVVNTGSAIQIDFNTRDLFDTGSSFAVYSSANVAGPYTDAGATITTLSGGFFRATVPLSGAAQFYRVRHQ
jgi:hypothetical protein